MKTFSPSRTIVVNRVELSDQDIAFLDQLTMSRTPDGRYWYDAVSGAWGLEDGPAIGFTAAGLALPGPPPADISAGSGGVFFNGRELHAAELAFLLAAFGMAAPGRYRLDADGLLSTEFGWPLANLRAAATMRPGHGAFSGIGAFGMVDAEGAVVNLPGGGFHAT